MQANPGFQPPNAITPTVAPVYSGANVNLPATAISPGVDVGAGMREVPTRRSGVVGGPPASTRTRTLPPPPPLPIDPSLIPIPQQAQ